MSILISKDTFQLNAGQNSSNAPSNGKYDADLHYFAIWMWYEQSFPT